MCKEMRPKVTEVLNFTGFLQTRNVSERISHLSPNCVFVLCPCDLFWPVEPSVKRSPTHKIQPNYRYDVISLSTKHTAACIGDKQEMKVKYSGRIR